jgi:hypothetical protein
MIWWDMTYRWICIFESQWLSSEWWKNCDEIWIREICDNGLNRNDWVKDDLQTCLPNRIQHIFRIMKKWNLKTTKQEIIWYDFRWWCKHENVSKRCKLVFILISYEFEINQQSIQESEDKMYNSWLSTNDWIIWITYQNKLLLVFWYVGQIILRAKQVKLMKRINHDERTKWASEQGLFLEIERNVEIWNRTCVSMESFKTKNQMKNWIFLKRIILKNIVILQLFVCGD